ncbi:hypothetical protein KHA80_12630 [Anaerobacillus sp. HL2]|nr:hypothetical protein KHA80_12630 [Anaerobacillus sp. HL2]
MSLGDDVNYNPLTKEVKVVRKTSTVSNLTTKDINDNGDGRDLKLVLPRQQMKSEIDHYRIMVVKNI